MSQNANIATLVLLEHCTHGQTSLGYADADISDFWIIAMRCWSTENKRKPTMTITTANALHCSLYLSCVASVLLLIGQDICVKHVASQITKWLGLWMLKIGKNICVTHVAPLVTKWHDPWMGYAL